jgi:sugar phosphate isomerase/epimerase
MPLPVALQLWSVREDCAADFAATLRAVAGLGYDGVEFAGYHEAPATDVAGWIAETGLKVAGAHVGWGLFEPARLAETLEYHEELGCTTLIVPGIPQAERETLDACLATSDRMASLTEELRAAGFRFGYHCHEADMRPLEGGQRPWDVIAEHTPADFILQYDTANGMSGGADPVQPLLDYPGRGVTVHAKEFSGPGGTATIGEGEVPWAAVVAACADHAGTEWLVVEHEQYGARSPLECAAACLEGLRAVQGS